MAMKHLEIAVIPGDGIGTEVTQAGLSVLRTVADSHGGLKLSLREFAWGCEHYLQTGTMMPEDGLQQLSDCQAILLGAVGHPSVDDTVSLWGLLLPIRQEFDQYINLRPVRLREGVAGRLAGKGPDEIDMLFVRENSEGEYSPLHGRMFRGTAREIVTQTTVFTRVGVERVLRYGFEQAQGRRRHLTVVTKANALASNRFWLEVAEELQPAYPDVTVQHVLADAAAMFLITAPEQFDVVVASNLFGDILTDEAAAIQGSIGLAASANLNVTREKPSMFEPVHGSAPDIAGKGVANPLGSILSVALMLSFLDESEAAALVEGAVDSLLKEGQIRTRDLGGRATTRAVGEEIVRKIRHACR